jgi:hydroxymethylglutaryl-CoA lyase
LTRARTDGVRVRGYVSTVLGCPYQGDVPLSDVVRVAARLHAMGCYEVSLGDTIGAGTPAKAARTMLRAVADVRCRWPRLRCISTTPEARHSPTSWPAWRKACAWSTAAVAGTGGCPYAQGASGNVASEDVVYMLHGLGFDTGVDLAALIDTGRWLSQQLGRGNGSKLGLAGLLQPTRD